MLAIVLEALCLLFGLDLFLIVAVLAERSNGTLPRAVITAKHQ